MDGTFLEMQLLCNSSTVTVAGLSSERWEVATVYTGAVTEAILTIGVDMSMEDTNGQ